MRQHCHRPWETIKTFTLTVQHFDLQSMNALLFNPEEIFHELPVLCSHLWFAWLMISKLSFSAEDMKLTRKLLHTIVLHFKQNELVLIYTVSYTKCSVNIFMFLVFFFFFFETPIKPKTESTLVSTVTSEVFIMQPYLFDYMRQTCFVVSNDDMIHSSSTDKLTECGSSWTIHFTQMVFIVY